MLHAADFARVPCVGLFGPTDPHEFGFLFVCRLVESTIHSKTTRSQSGSRKCYLLTGTLTRSPFKSDGFGTSELFSGVCQTCATMRGATRNMAETAASEEETFRLVSSSSATLASRRVKRVLYR